MRDMTFLYPDGTPTTKNLSLTPPPPHFALASPNIQGGPNFSPYEYFIHDPLDSAANNVGVGISGANTATGGSNYNSSLPNGASDVVNVAPPGTSGVQFETKFSTTINPKTGELNSTETGKVTIFGSDATVKLILGDIGNAVTAFDNAVWAAATDVASFSENLAYSFGGWVSNLIKSTNALPAQDTQQRAYGPSTSYILQQNQNQMGLGVGTNASTHSQLLHL